MNKVDKIEYISYFVFNVFHLSGNIIHNNILYKYTKYSTADNIVV